MEDETCRIKALNREPKPRVSETACALWLPSPDKANLVWRDALSVAFNNTILLMLYKGNIPFVRSYFIWDTYRTVGFYLRAGVELISAECNRHAMYICSREVVFIISVLRCKLF
jgi:hypothetical protein